MKVVLDSSVLIAASISRAGVCAELLEDVLTHHELMISDFIAQELGRKLRDKFNFPESEVRQLRRFLVRMATTVVPTDLPARVCRDPSDMVTVDKDLLALGGFQSIAIIKPGDFWRRTTG